MGQVNRERGHIDKLALEIFQLRGKFFLLCEDTWTRYFWVRSFSTCPTSLMVSETVMDIMLQNRFAAGFLCDNRICFQGKPFKEMAKKQGIEIDFKPPGVESREEQEEGMKGGLAVVKRLLRQCKSLWLGKHYYGILDFVQTSLRD